MFRDDDNVFKEHIITIILFIVNLAKFIYELVITKTEVITGLSSRSGNLAIGFQVGKHPSFLMMINSLFTHASLAHFLNNMIIFLAIGWLAEPLLNHSLTLLVTLLGGFLGNALSAAVIPRVMICGFSGAIMALVGALFSVLLIMAIFKRLNNQFLLWSTSGLLLIMLFETITNIHINLISHITGLAIGFIVGMIYAGYLIYSDDEID